jgi:hypothetical protein
LHETNVAPVDEPADRAPSLGLGREGYPVIAPPASPLRSLNGDSAYIANVLAVVGAEARAITPDVQRFMAERALHK